MIPADTLDKIRRLSLAHTNLSDRIRAKIRNLIMAEDGHSRQSSNNLNSFRFLDLPREIRFMVYECLPQKAYLPLLSGSADLLWQDWACEPHILFTCHLILEEAIPVMRRAVLSKVTNPQIIIPVHRVLWLPRLMHTTNHILTVLELAQSIAQRTADATEDGLFDHIFTYAWPYAWAWLGIGSDATCLRHYLGRTMFRLLWIGESVIEVTVIYNELHGSWELRQFFWALTVNYTARMRLWRRVRVKVMAERGGNNDQRLVAMLHWLWGIRRRLPFFVEIERADGSRLGFQGEWMDTV